MEDSVEASVRSFKFAEYGDVSIHGHLADGTHRYHMDMVDVHSVMLEQVVAWRETARQQRLKCSAGLHTLQGDVILTSPVQP
jgi:hypothetical protein